MILKRCIFAGPSFQGQRPSGSLALFSPASLGSIYQACRAGYKIIGLIDGNFGTVPSVWHKEILYAIASGVKVLGGGSIGALRAAELDRFGMEGVGTVYRLYRRGSIEDDDEVCLIHGPKELDFRPLSLPMIDVRVNLRVLRRSELISTAEESVVLEKMKTLHFSRRTSLLFLHHLGDTLGGRRGDRLFDLMQESWISIKRRDAEQVLKSVMACSFNSAPIGWTFPQTNNWSDAIGSHGSLPDLEAWD